jgi:hypothetical protein
MEKKQTEKQRNVYIVPHVHCYTYFQQDVNELFR